MLNVDSGRLGLTFSCFSTKDKNKPGSVDALKANNGSRVAFPLEVMMPSTYGSTVSSSISGVNSSGVGAS